MNATLSWVGRGDRDGGDGDGARFDVRLPMTLGARHRMSSYDRISANATFETEVSTVSE